jgi:hypothetical protein
MAFPNCEEKERKMVEARKKKKIKEEKKEEEEEQEEEEDFSNTAEIRRDGMNAKAATRRGIPSHRSNNKDRVYGALANLPVLSLA